MAEKCPICTFPIKGYPAISRADNKTHICSSCGTAEGLLCYKMRQQGASPRDVRDALKAGLRGKPYKQHTEVRDAIAEQSIPGA
jgi:hypothetical protein